MATVFAVDDDPAMLSIYREMLVMLNHHVVAEAKDGEEAVRLYKGLKSHPDIMLMDYRMPHRDGISAMQEIKCINPKQCIIIVTSDPRAAKKAKNLGANTYVLKPFRLDRLSKTIQSVLLESEKVKMHMS